ncbi:hypothetical protein AVEN_258288-1, partial [Araneus ventricosus]
NGAPDVIANDTAPMLLVSTCLQFEPRQKVEGLKLATDHV